MNHRRAGTPDQVGGIAEDSEEFAVAADAFRHAPTRVSM
jgi:hypothetical protein